MFNESMGPVIGLVHCSDVRFGSKAASTDCRLPTQSGPSNIARTMTRRPDHCAWTDADASFADARLPFKAVQLREKVAKENVEQVR